MRLTVFNRYSKIWGEAYPKIAMSKIRDTLYKNNLLCILLRLKIIVKGFLVQALGVKKTPSELQRQSAVKKCMAGGVWTVVGAL